MGFGFLFKELGFTGFLLTVTCVLSIMFISVKQAILLNILDQVLIILIWVMNLFILSPCTTVSV